MATFDLPKSQREVVREDVREVQLLEHLLK